MNRNCKQFIKCSNFSNGCIAKNSCCDLDPHQLKQWAAGKNFHEIVDKAFYIDGNEKRYSHQRCIESNAYAIYRKKIKELEAEVLSVKNFHELFCLLSFECLNETPERIAGIGELTEYDIALRIGACLGIYPEKVYLHAGTRIGSRKLGIKQYYKKWLEVNELPKWLQSEKPHSTEDFLCICKEFLSKDDKKSKECLECYKSFHEKE